MKQRLIKCAIRSFNKKALWDDMDVTDGDEYEVAYQFWDYSLVQATNGLEAESWYLLFCAEALEGS